MRRGLLLGLALLALGCASPSPCRHHSHLPYGITPEEVGLAEFGDCWDAPPSPECPLP